MTPQQQASALRAEIAAQEAELLRLDKQYADLTRALSKATISGVRAQLQVAIELNRQQRDNVKGTIDILNEQLILALGEGEAVNTATAQGLIGGVAERRAETRKWAVLSIVGVLAVIALGWAWVKFKKA